MIQSATRYRHILALCLIFAGIIALALQSDTNSALAKKPKYDANSEFYLPEYYFNGNEYIGVPRAPKIEKEITITCFFKPEREAFKNASSIICRWKNINGYQSYDLCLSEDYHIKIWLEICADYSNINHEVALTLKNSAKVDEWQHVAIIYDGKDIKAYYNGVLDSDKIFSGQLISPKAPDLLLGGKENWVDFSKTSLYKGELREAHIYNRAVKEDELLRLYQEGKKTIPESPPPQ